MKWTQKQIEELARMYPTGMHYREIGKIIGKSRGAIAGRVNRMAMNGVSVTDTRHKSKPRKYSKIDRGDWDAKTFEPYAVRKVRLAMERENVV